MSGRDYLAQHDVQAAITKAVTQVLREKPSDPLAAIASILRGGKGGALAKLQDKPCIHLVWRVPKADEAAVDAYWKSHEEWMRKSHVLGLDGDDATTPRLLEFNISKGEELNNPMDPTSGLTGNLLYIMSETYAAAAGIASHMAKGSTEWPGMAKLGEMGAKYGVFMEAGATKVFTNFE